MTIRVLAVTSEIYPLVKTGGLADVAGALPDALRPNGVQVVTLVPGYPAVTAALAGAETVWSSEDLFGGAARLRMARAAKLDLLVLDAPHLFARPGNPYTDANGRDWTDNALRFGALSFAGARVGLGDVAAFVPDVVHAHDWQAGLALAYLAYAGRPRPATMMTVHNLAFQGRFPADLLSALRIPPEAYSIHGVEYYGGIGFLKAGLRFADRITTVSPTYAAEIQTEGAGCGLEGLLRARAADLSGILNGIDTEVWNPRTDPRIASRFDAHDLAGRVPNKAALQQAFGLEPDPDRLLFGIVSRLTWQKGTDLLVAALPALIEREAQLAVLGTGEADLEQRLAALAAAHRGSIGCVIGYDEDLAHLIQAGTDALLVPSRFEPCGLTQLCALRYGAVPVVARVGGLADTVVDVDSGACSTGIQFDPVTAAAFERALGRTRDLWSDRDRWRGVQANGMARDVSWAASAKKYAKLYENLMVAAKE